MQPKPDSGNCQDGASLADSGQCDETGRCSENKKMRRDEKTLDVPFKMIGSLGNNRSGFQKGLGFPHISIDGSRGQ